MRPEYVEEGGPKVDASTGASCGAGGHRLSRATVLVLILALLAAALPATAATLHATTVEGPASFAARIETGADGAFRATIRSCGEKTASTDGVGMLLYDGSGAFRFGFGVTGHGSPDRTILQLGELRDDVSVTYPSYGPICPYSALNVDVGGAPFATHRIVMWAAGLDGDTTFTITAAGGSVLVNVGGAIALGDPELEAGDANVQVQRRLSGFNGVGVKLIENAHHEVAVNQRAWGFWGYNDAKFVCAAVCAGPALADQACVLAAGTTCDARISWQGPAGGASGRPTYTLQGEPSGAYRFRVDHKLDAYNPGGGVFVPPGALVFPGENYGYLSLADVSMP